MNPPKLPRSALGHLLMSMLAINVLLAQETEKPKSDEVIQLSPFEIRAENSNRYQASDTTSGSRVRQEIVNSPQSINVVTSELLRDVGAGRVLDALQYVPGVTESTQPNGLDRITVRGFQIDGSTIDGFSNDFTQANTDPVMIDRIEVLKGPSAILAPAGSPGGTVNKVTKKPLFVAPRSSIEVQAGLFDAGDIRVDSTGRLGGEGSKFAYRLVGSYGDFEQYYGGINTRRYSFSPSVSYLISPSTKLTVQGWMSESRSNGYYGIPIDPSSGTENTAQLLIGVSHRTEFDPPDMYRYDNRQQLAAFLTSDLTEHLSVRLAGRLLSYKNEWQYMFFNPASGSGGAINPLTGAYTPGFVYGPAPTFTPSPIPAISRTYLRSGGLARNTLTTENFQNDWVYKRSFRSVGSTTVAGFAYVRTFPTDTWSGVGESLSTAPTDFNAPVITPTIRGGNVTLGGQNFRTRQLYANETLELLRGKVLLSGGISNLDVDSSSFQQNSSTVWTTNADKDAVSYGIVAKPWEGISLFFGHSENAAPTSDMRPVGTPLFSFADQDEFGVRLQFLNNRLHLEASHFDITQTAYSVPNPLNYTNPPPVPALPPLYSDRKAEGWEFSTTFEILKGFNVIANYTDFTNRDPNNMPFRNTAEKSAGVFARYEFLAGAAKGFSASVGVTYLGRRPGDAAVGVTAASTPTNQIPNQPTFWLPERTLVNLGFGYGRGSWTFQANINNALDEEYLAASLNRYLVYPGVGTNLIVTLTYKF